MKLVIRAHSLKNEPLSQSITGHFDEAGGTIGRSDSNTMTLPDPERHVSRLQAEVCFANGAFAIRNVGSANPIVLNGRPVAPGESVAVAGGEELSIGGYAMRVELERHAAVAPDMRAAVAPRTVIAASADEPKTDPPEGGVDPFADFASAPPPPRRPHDEFDPFADLSAASSDSAGDAALAAFLDASPSPSPRAPAPSHAGAVDDLLGVSHASAGPGIDTMFGLEKNAAARDDPMHAFLALKGEANAQTKDPLVAFGLKAAPAPAGAPPAFDHVPELAAAYVPPAVQGVPLAKAPAVPRAAPPRVDGPGNDVLWRAFCDGAGVSSLPAQRLDAEQMRVIGRLLRSAIDGTLKLMAVRAAAKQELRAQVTTIQAKHNNPLKFAADPATALAQLLQPPLRGFMGGPDAMRDAMDDLLGHSIGTMTGMRAALQGMLARFEPSRLERRLTSHAVIDALMPTHRRAKLWELYVQHHQRVHEEAQEDFHELFGRAFVKAYEEQLDRLSPTRRKPR